jgi:glycosyltransferase involved in cell wall biosynthesis
VKRWLLVIGKVQSRKKQTDAVRVLRALIDKGWKDFGLIIAGDCDAKYQLEMDAVISECYVNDRVVMLGNYSDISNLFSLQPICLLTSLREALPGSVIESFLAGRPCFMYPCEGAEDIFGPHQHLFVSDDFKPSMLVNKMLPLLNNAPQMQYETDALQKRAQKLFSSEAHFNNITSLLGINTTNSCLNSR